jgi:hypothetical protein
VQIELKVNSPHTHNSYRTPCKLPTQVLRGGVLIWQIFGSARAHSLSTLMPYDSTTPLRNSHKQIGFENKRLPNEMCAQLLLLLLLRHLPSSPPTVALLRSPSSSSPTPLRISPLSGVTGE